MTTTPAPYRFDLNLDERAESPHVLNEAALAEKLKAARMDGFAEGYAEGERGVVASAGRKLANAAEMLADRAAGMMALIEEARHDATMEGVRLAMSVARKLACNLIARQPTAELEALVNECLSSLEGVPHLVIRCHPDMAAVVRDATEARITLTGYAGALVVIGDPELSLSDGQIEWADGGLVRDLDAISAHIDAEIAAYLNPGSAGSTQESAS